MGVVGVDDALTVPLLYALATPLVVLVHELGHTAVPLAVSREPVTVDVGPGFSRPLFRVRAGRLTVVVRRLFFWVFWGGLCDWQARLTPRQHFWAVAGGPLASLLGLGAAALVGLRTYPVWLVAQGFMILSSGQLLITLWPMPYPTWLLGYVTTASDGAQLLKLWSRQRT